MLSVSRVESNSHDLDVNPWFREVAWFLQEHKSLEEKVLLMRVLADFDVVWLSPDRLPAVSGNC